MVEEKKFSRREFVVGSAGFAAGVAVGSGSLGLLSGCISKPEPKVVEKIVEVEKPAKKIPLPWPYKKLDPEQVAEITYNNWYKGFCTYAVASGIIIPLQEKVGEPYTSFPLDALVFGHGGVVGWGTMCGTMLGAGIATSLAAAGTPVTGPGEQILNEVIHWYSNAELPIYTPKSPKANIKTKSTSGSPLCHISVGKWMKKEGVGFWTPERKERCARLSADVAVQTVKLLNDWADGKFKSDLKLPAVTYAITAQHNCAECHQTAVPKLPGT